MNSPGLYIHVPFCRRRCPFCDFAITTDLSHVTAWEDALVREMELRAPDWRESCDTVYFGGGTPSLVASSMERIIGVIGQRFVVADGAEVTIEANPGTLSRDDYARLTEAGVNRLSLGVQSFSDADLVFLGRDHDVQESLDAFEFARAAGLENITVDLIYGLPSRDPTHWKEQINRCAELGPDHVSAYALTYEPGTAMTRQKERGDFTPVSDRLAAELFDTTARELGHQGFSQYEVSSFTSGPELESRHNKKYWRRLAYLGLGPSAHSSRAERRWWNVRNVSDYVARLNRDELAVDEIEDLTVEQRRLETLFLGLRWREGVDLDRFEMEFGEDLRNTRGEIIDQLRNDGFARTEEGPLRLTTTGLARADAITRQLA